MTAIEDGLYQPTMKARMAELERQKTDIAARMALAPQVIPDVHPGIAEIYRRQIERFPQALEDPETRLDALDAIRSLIHRIVLHPGEKRGEMHATLRGALIGILDFAKEGFRPAAVVTTRWLRVRWDDDRGMSDAGGGLALAHVCNWLDSDVRMHDAIDSQGDTSG